MRESIELIELERIRQVHEEGWSQEHDDKHRVGELAMAAACYASPEEIFIKRTVGGEEHIVEAWPWELEWDKRDKHDRLKQLIIAGALIAAEIERLVRAESGASQ